MHCISDASDTDFDMEINTGTGWTEVADLFSGTGVEYRSQSGVWWKAMGATPDTQVITQGKGGADSGNVAIAMAFTGVDTTTPMDVTVTTATGTGTFVANPPSIDFSDAGAAVVVVPASSHNDNGSVLVLPTDYQTNAVSVTQGETRDCTGAMGYYLSPSDPEDPDAVTYSAGVDDAAYAWTATTLALRSAGGGGPSTISLCRPIVTVT